MFFVLSFFLIEKNPTVKYKYALECRRFDKWLPCQAKKFGIEIKYLNMRKWMHHRDDPLVMTTVNFF